MVKDKLFIRLDGLIYLQSFYENEKLNGEKLKALCSQVVPSGTPQYDDLQEYQVDVLIKAVKNQVFILTGAPGTGKTFTIKKIIRSFPDARVTLAAPTVAI